MVEYAHEVQVQPFSDFEINSVTLRSYSVEDVLEISCNLKLSFSSELATVSKISSFEYSTILIFSHFQTWYPFLHLPFARVTSIKS